MCLPHVDCKASHKDQGALKIPKLAFRRSQGRQLFLIILYYLLLNSHQNLVDNRSTYQIGQDITCHVTPRNLSSYRRRCDTLLTLSPLSRRSADVFEVLSRTQTMYLSHDVQVCTHRCSQKQACFRAPAARQHSDLGQKVCVFSSKASFASHLSLLRSSYSILAQQKHAMEPTSLCISRDKHLFRLFQLVKLLLLGQTPCKPYARHQE